MSTDPSHGMLTRWCVNNIIFTGTAANRSGTKSWWNLHKLPRPTKVMTPPVVPIWGLLPDDWPTSGQNPGDKVGRRIDRNRGGADGDGRNHVTPKTKSSQDQRLLGELGFGHVPSMRPGRPVENCCSLVWSPTTWYTSIMAQTTCYRASGASDWLMLKSAHGRSKSRKPSALTDKAL